MQLANLTTLFKSGGHILFNLHLGYQRYEERINLELQDWHVFQVYSRKVGIGWMRGL